MPLNLFYQQPRILSMLENLSKRGRLQYSKCTQCRKDKQKVWMIYSFWVQSIKPNCANYRPLDRIWSHRCDRCVQYGYTCSQNHKASRERKTRCERIRGSDQSSTAFSETSPQALEFSLLAAKRTLWTGRDWRDGKMVCLWQIIEFHF